MNTLEETTNETAEGAVELRPTVINLKRLLVPLDFSDHSRKALDYAVKFAEQFGAELTIVHVVTPVIYAEGMVLPAAMENIDQLTREEAAKSLDKLRAGIDPRIEVTTEIRIGTPYAEVLEAAKESETDLLVITTHGYTGLKHFLMGSTAEKLVRHAPCPVMIVRDKEHEFV